MKKFNSLKNIIKIFHNLKNIAEKFLLKLVYNLFWQYTFSFDELNKMRKGTKIRK